MLKLNVWVLFSYVVILAMVQKVEKQKMGLDLNGTEILGSKQQYRVKFIAKSGKPPYTFKYSNVPKTWVITQKYLFAPKSNSNIYEQYLISVMVIDSSQAQFKCSLIFLSNYAHMFMDTTVYPYNVQVPSMYYGAIKMPVLKSPLQQGLQQKIRIIIQQAAKNKKLNSFSSAFEKLLLPSQIQEIIGTSNIPALVRLISRVPKMSLNCIQQIGYLAQISSIGIYVMQEKKNRLDELLKNYKQKLASKQYSYPDQNQNVNKSEQARIIQQQIDKLNTSRIKQQYLATIDKLKKAYSQYNKIQQQTDILKSTLISLNIEADQITKQLNNKNIELQGISLKLSPTTLNPKQKNQYQTSYDEMVQIISFLNSELTKRRETIKEVQNNISKLNNEGDIKSLQSKQIQVDIQRLQSTISKNYIQQLKLRQSLSFYYLDNVIIFVFNNEGYHLNLREVGGIDEIVQLYKDISVINQTMVYLNSLLDGLYYQCYGLKIQKSNQTELFVYTVDYGDFVKYIKSAYQADSKYKIAQAASDLQPSKATLLRINVLDSIWTEKFGEIIDTPNANSNATKPINSYCEATNMLESFTGIIVSIHTNLIQVRVSSTQYYYVLLGACSRIEMYGKVTPQPGNLIFWKGNLISKAIYDGYFILIL